MSFKAQGGWVLVSIKREETTPSGIVLPDNNSDEFFVGSVLSIGKDAQDEEDLLDKLRVGDKVVVAKGGRWKVGKQRDSLIFAVPYDDIICTVDED